MMIFESSDIIMAQKRLHRGDWFEFKMGLSQIRGDVQEDRGPIGIKGRRLYLIEFMSDTIERIYAHVELLLEFLRRTERAAMPA
jgi:hypothetical protein